MLEACGGCLCWRLRPARSSAARQRATRSWSSTKLDAYDWYPTWPDVPDAENRECNCDSSTYGGLPIAIPRAPSTASLTVIQARKPQTILQAPSEANNYTLIVEVTDVGFSGSSWVIIDIDVVAN